MKNGLKAFDSDMHVYDPAFLYEKYMNPKGETVFHRGKGTANTGAWNSSSAGERSCALSPT